MTVRCNGHGVGRCVLGSMQLAHAAMDLLRIKQALMTKLTHESQFSFLNTRLILRTGVDLTNIRPKDGSVAQAKRVLDALKDLGYDLRTEIGQ